jgi:hypothetical protein
MTTADAGGEAPDPTEEQRGRESSAPPGRSAPLRMILGVVAAALLICCCSAVIGGAVAWSAGLFNAR